MRGRALSYAIFGALTLAAAPAGVGAQATSATAQVATSATTTLVGHFYDRRQDAPIWFRSGAGPEAIAQLNTILRRAPVDGFAAGPTFAVQIEALAAKAQAGDTAAAKAADELASTAWAEYVKVIKAPTKGMIYGDARVRPQPAHPDRTLTLAAAAPNLAAHLLSVSNVNPVYTQLREAAVAEAAANGGTPSAKMLLNLDRARVIPATGKFVVVDITGAMLHMYDNGQLRDSMKVVVGNDDYPTPMIASTMYYAIANPYWHVPPHLIRRMAPNIAKGPDAYMKRSGYEVISDFSGNPTILPASSVNWKAVAAGTEKVILRQKPNGQNSMGKMKFPFPNPEGIFLHDSPAREHFAKTQRDISNGCVRVEDWRRLARFLFNGDPPAAASSAPEQAIPLPGGIPIYLTYLTLKPEGGTIASARDIYGLDRGAVRSAATGTGSVQGGSVSGSAN